MKFYKTTLILCTVFGVSVLSFAQDTFLEHFLRNMKDKYEVNAGDNSIDSFSLKKVLDWDEPLFKLHLLLDATLKGFTNYEIHQAFLTPDLKLKLNVTLKDTTCSGSYNLNGTFYKILPLNGNGNILIKLENFNIFLDSQVAVENGTTKLLYYDMSYSFNTFEVNVSGLSGYSDLGDVIQNFIRDLVPNTLNKKREQIISIANNLLFKKGNIFLKHATLKTFVEILKSLFIY